MIVCVHARACVRGMRVCLCIYLCVSECTYACGGWHKERTVERGDGGKRGGEKEKERKRGVSNSSDRGTPQTKRNCLLHCQLMAIPASSPLNMKHKHNVHTIRHFSITGPHRLIWVYVGITTVTTTHRVIYTSL